MLPEVTPRARRPTYDGSDDSDPDVEHGGMVDATEPLLHAGKLSKAHASPCPSPAKPAKGSIADAGGSGAAGQSQHQREESSQLALIKSAIAVAVWYSSNIGLLLLNKYMLSGFGFRRPVFLTLWHMIACTLLSGALAAAHLVPVQHITNARQFGKVAVLALVFCLSVVLGNISLRYIPVSFNQAIGATTPLCTAGLAFAMLGQREPRRVYLTLIPVVAGVILATGAEPSFQLLGFLAAVFATFARAFKSILQGLLLTDPSEKLDSVNLLRYMTPIASAALMLLVAVMEPDIADSLPHVGDEHWVRFYVILSANGALAFLVNLTNFLVTRYTSALTLQVLGNAKGVFATGISIVVFGNPWTFSSIGGYGIATAGVGLFMHEKRRAKAVVTSSATRP